MKYTDGVCSNNLPKSLPLCEKGQESHGSSENEDGRVAEEETNGMPGLFLFETALS